MEQLKNLLASISAGRVLDVATGSGGFIHFLLDGLKDYSEIIGIDSNPHAAAAFTESFKAHPGIRFVEMDATHMLFPDSSFDLVSISNSLHHFEDPLAVLREMARVLRPGGHFLLAEMYCDGQSETQLTHVQLHHWWAAVDRAGGITHNETYRRAQLAALLAGWQDLALFDLSDTSADPRNPDILAELTPVFERYLQRAEGHPELQARGEQLHKRVEEVGFHAATTLLALGVKPA
jgi:ubiquinone/menaquinone biosynthesis C-methylase UbiE